MSYAEYLEEQKIETREIIAEMLEDGLSADAEYLIEHHFAADTIEQCQSLILAARDQGLDTTPPEEFELDPQEGEGTVFCFDILVESDLDVEGLDEQTEMMFAFAESHQCEYDGWGIELESDEDDNEEETLND